MTRDHRGLQALIDEERIDELLDQVSIEEITDTWLRYQRKESHPEDVDEDPDWWAVEVWYSPGWHDNEDRVRAGLLDLIDRCDDEDLGSVAAGPLEGFICDDESRLHWIEGRAKESERFRKALGQVHVYPQLSDRAILRVERAAGVPLAEPDRERRQERMRRG